MWKALLLYVLFIIASVMAGLIMARAGVEYRSITHLAVLISLNLVGLAIFYMFFKKGAT
ncbi:MAG TPA: hypothetical protein PLA72_10810 [Smithellaceae bacterium]|jgi:hypothetical protein|nr:hypothetical protein [Prolixibacteraceae bacterium]HPM11839.1 hypothetical protein [Paludibacter sp.]HQQ88479.1 hypothetical protein [Smithellaceae bacterium]